eukprot:scaffold5138_cov170-Amphora_coffeaeformis.AAC.5
MFSKSTPVSQGAESRKRRCVDLHVNASNQSRAGLIPKQAPACHSYSNTYSMCVWAMCAGVRATPLTSRA